MTSRLTWQTVLLVGLLLSCQPLGNAQQSGESKLGTVISSLPYLINSPGKYVLQQDFLNLNLTSGTSAIQINVPNVVLDLNGYTISNSAAGAGTTAYGVYAMDQSNVTIRNGTIQGFMTGVALTATDWTNPGATSYGHMVESLHVNHCTYEGISVAGSGGTVRSCQVEDIGGSTVLDQLASAYGIDFMGTGMRCLNCDVSMISAGGTDGLSYAIYLDGSYDAIVVNNRMSTAGYGIYFNGATGVYRHNLASGMLMQGYVGGTGAGSNIVDSNSDGVDDDWEMKYFGTLNVNLEALELGGGGLTNLQAYQRGSDPNDYYNGVIPSLVLGGGGNQRGAIGSLLPQPISVIVNGGNQNAPVKFTSAGGALLAPDANGSSQPTATITVPSTKKIAVPDSNQSIFVAQVYVYLPSNIGVACTITATVTTGGRNASLSTTATTTDPNTQPPSSFDVAYNTENYVAFSLAPSDETLPVSVEVSLDKGVSWSKWGVINPGATSYILNGLPHETHLLVRAFSGVDPSSNSGGGVGTNGAQLNASPSPTSTPTSPVNVTLYLQPHIFGDKLSGGGYNWSFFGFSPTNGQFNHYLSWDEYEDLFDPSAISGEWNIEANPYLGSYDGYRSPPETYLIVFGSNTVDSDTGKHGNASYPGEEAEPPIGIYNVLLSEPYTLDDFWLDSEGWLGSFSGNYAPDVNDAMHSKTAIAPYYESIYELGGNEFGADHVHRFTKLRYHFLVNKNPNGHLAFDEVFVPKDGSAITHHVQNWDTKGATQSPLNQPWTLDPLASNNKAEGTYRVLTAELYPYGHADNQGYDGDLVPSIKNDGTGQKHFVTPQAAGGHVQIEAKITGSTDSGMTFSAMYKFAVLLNGTDVTASVAIQSSQTVYVKTDAANHYVVQLQTNDGKKTVVDSVNVWVVWATGHAEQGPNDGFVVPAAGVVAASIDGHNSGFLAYEMTPDNVQSYLKIQFDIKPQSLFDLTQDVPDLNKKNETKVPPPNEHHLVAVDELLSDGAEAKWDISQSMRLEIFNPNLIPHGAFPAGAGRLFDHQPKVDDLVIDFPLNDIEGNDDIAPADSYQENHPYSSYSVPSNDENSILNHPKGSLVFADRQVTRILNYGADNGYRFAKFSSYKTFVRLEIGNNWYRVSGHYRYHFDLDVAFVKVGVSDEGHWEESGDTDAGLDGYIED